ncbi:MAG: sensor histidine kinase [Cyclobacteriaceae bacterium]|nr:sensor histidine kinase [Cyclobacteriaceae bacterium]
MKNVIGIFVLATGIALFYAGCSKKEQTGIPSGAMNIKEAADSLYSDAFDLMATNYDSAQSIIQSLQLLPGFDTDTALIIRHTSLLAYSAMVRSLYDSAIFGYTRSYILSKAINDTSFMDAALNNTGIGFKNLGLYEDALDYYLASLKIKLARKNPRLIGLTLNNVGNLFIQLKKSDEAIKYLTEGLSYARESEFFHLESTLLNNLANAHVLQESYDSALYFYNQALDINKKIDYQVELSRNYHNIGNLYHRLGRHKEGHDQLKKALEIRLALPSVYDQLETKGALGKVLADQGNFQQGLSFLMEKNQFSKDHHIPHLHLESLLELSNVYEAMGDFMKSLEHRKNYDRIKDTLHNEQLNDKIKALEIKFETDQLKDALEQSEYVIRLQKAGLEREHFIATLWMLLSILMAAFIVLLVYAYRKKVQSERLIAEKTRENLETRLLLLEQKHKMQDIHSLVNAQEQERVRIARDLHDGLGRLMSSILLSVGHLRQETKENNVTEEIKWVEQNLQQVSHEIRAVSHNLMPPSLLKFGLLQGLEEYLSQIEKKTKISISLDHDFDESSLNDFQKVMIFRMIQEMTGNIVKHSNAKDAYIQILSDTHDLYLTVEDSGVGFDQQNASNAKGIGLSNIRSRAHLLGAKMQLHSEKGKGTTYHIQIPVHYVNHTHEENIIGG